MLAVFEADAVGTATTNLEGTLNTIRRKLDATNPYVIVSWSYFCCSGPAGL